MNIDQNDLNQKCYQLGKLKACVNYIVIAFDLFKETKDINHLEDAIIRANDVVKGSE